MSELLKQWNREMAGVIEGVRRSLVQVHSGRSGAGAGTIWHPDGLILTNAHVVRRRHLDVILPNGQTLPARVLAHDPSRDLAALGVEASDLSTIDLGDSRQLQPGQWVLALGHPWGVAGAVTAGVVAGVGARLPEMPLADRDWIAVSLHLRPGHSGGPLVDETGRLVGINTIMAGPDVGLAVPVHVAKDFLRQALDGERRARRLDKQTIYV
ncbi:MAG: trypsin-like peptidase domain-containing protein [Anaerolineae bacterium]